MFSTPLLRSKLFRPPLRPFSVRRPQLTALLDAAERARLVLVSAPPGFGKTSLLVDWIEQRELRAAWIALDAGDNDLARFLMYLLAALREAAGQADLGRAAETMLGSLNPSQVESLLSTLFNELEGIDSPLVLVLDDYQFIENRSVHQALAFLLEYLPAQLRLVIATRADPPLPLARLRANGQLVEIRADDLRFSPQETAAFLDATRRAGTLQADEAASAAFAQTLTERTEGWAAGVQMACLALRGADAPGAFLEAFSGSHRYILDYLTEEVLARLPAPTVDFLLRTSVLERFCADLCAAVLAEAVESPYESQEMLESLERANLFLVPLDGERCWYRYHHLFADLLRARLRQFQPDAVPQLHARAADWFERSVLPGEAVEHWLAAAQAGTSPECYETAARLIERSAMRFFLRGETTTYLNWLAALPEETVEAHPRLQIYEAAVAGLQGEVEKAGRLMEHIHARVAGEQVQGGLSPELQMNLNYMAGVEIAQADLSGRYQDVLRLASSMLDNSRLDPINRVTVLLSMGHARFVMGDLDAALAALAEAEALTPPDQNPYGLALALGHQARAQRARGDLNAAQALLERGLTALSGIPAAAHMGLGLMEAALGDVLRERGDLLSARSLLEAGLKHLPVLGGPSGLLLARAGLARLQINEGNPGAALKQLSELKPLLGQAGVYPEHTEGVEAALVMAWLAAGETAQALRWAENLPAPLDGLPLIGEYARITAARVYCALGQTDQALARLDTLAREAEAGGRYGRRMEIDALRAAALHQAGEEARSLAALGGALEIAGRGGSALTILEAGESIPGLLALGIRGQAWSAAITATARRLLACRPAESSSSKEAAPPLVENLSERELEVLRLVAEGLSNAEIAARLVLSTGTVRVHTANIYRKLDVESRTQAVAKARALGLVK